MLESMYPVLLKESIGTLETALRTRVALSFPNLRALWWEMAVPTTISIILIRCLIWVSGTVSYLQRPTSGGKQTTAPSSMTPYRPSARPSLINSTTQWQILIHTMHSVLAIQIQNLRLLSETLSQRTSSLLENTHPSWRRALVRSLPVSMPSLSSPTLTMLLWEPSSIFPRVSKLGISAKVTSTTIQIPLDRFRFIETWRTSTESSSIPEILIW